VEVFEGIDNRGYAIPFIGGDKKIVKIGAEFNIK